jgi:4-carboxymuconolactone decarboxylase
VTDPYLIGLAFMASAGVDSGEDRSRAAEIAPDFVRLAIGFTFGELFSRPGLDRKTRLAAAIAAELARSGSTDTLQELVRAALHLGWSKSEVVELIIQTSAVAGVNVALAALKNCHDLLAEWTPRSQSCAADDAGQA